jgi:hypothetical protein
MWTLNYSTLKASLFLNFKSVHSNHRNVLKPETSSKPRSQLFLFKIA